MAMRPCIKYVTLLLAVILERFSYVCGQGLCRATKHINQDSNMYFKPFKRLDNIGVLQCTKMCNRHTLCEKISHNREQLTCDLMMRDAVPGDMTSLLDAHSVETETGVCFHGKCLENEVCVQMKNGSGVCVLQDSCPTPEWVPFNHKCYLFPNKTMTADENRNFCTMIRIDDEAVYNFLLEQINEREYDRLLIGANKNVNDEWVWEAGDAMNNAIWGPGEPNDYGEMCVVIQPLWNNVHCSTFSTYPGCEVPFSG